MRILGATAALATLGLLSACVTQPGAGGAPVSGQQSCIDQVQSQSGSSGVTIASDSNPGGAGIISLNVPDGSIWTCYTNANGGIASVTEDNPGSHR